MGITLKHTPGFDRTWNGTMRDADGVPVDYPSDATFDTAVWRGQDEAPLFSPAAAWVDSSVGTFTVTIAANQATPLEPGLYRMQVGVISGGVRSLAFDGHLEIREVPGTASNRTPYVSNEDVLFWYDQLETLQTDKGGDAAALKHRCEASDDFDYRLKEAYKSNARQVRTRGATRDPVLGTFDVPDPAATIPTTGDFAAIVAGGGVIVDRNVRELVSKLAIANFLDRQQTMDSRNSYRDVAAEFMAEVDRLWKATDVPIDTSDPLDAVADMTVGRDIILLPSGAAP